MPGIADCSGVRLIRLPLPFELNHVNVGLVPAPDGYLLIDTGMDSEDSHEALESALREAGVRWNEIRSIVITHMHPDHVGLLSRVSGLTGARLYMHRDEVAQLNRIVAASRGPWIDEGLRLAGTPPPLIAAIHHALRHLQRALPSVRADVELAGGEEIATALGPMRVVWTPGHTVGHICLYWPDRQMLYSGDHMIEKITPNIGWLPGRDMLGEYIRSLRLLEPFTIDCVLPSHGTPFSGHREWIRKTIGHHEERCAKIAGALGAEPRTAHHLVPALWDRHLSPFHYHFALFEVLSHLEYMRGRREVRRTPGEDGAIVWERAA